MRRAPMLVTDTPILAVIAEMEADLKRLRELAPHSDSRPTLESYYSRLNAALAEARTAEVWVDTDEAARWRGVTKAAITYRCRRGLLAARKDGGVWAIHKDSLNGGSPMES